MSKRAALVIMGVLSLADIAGLALTDGEHPPYAVAAVGTALGLASLVLVVRVWRGDLRGVKPLLVLRVLSAATAVPAFFVDGVPAIAVVAAAAFVVLTAVAVVLLARPAHHSQAAA